MKVMILRGIPGCGKSTWAKTQRGAVIVSADNFFMHDGEYKFDPTKIAHAHYDCFRKYLAAIRRKSPLIIVDNTNTSLWEISPYVLAGESHGYTVEIHSFKCPVEVAVGRNIHGVPPKSVQAMFDHWEQPLPWWNEISHDTK